mgnify:CR=1 FL=1
MTARRKHRWGDKAVHPHKTERDCLNRCGIVKVSRHESEGGRDVYWTEYWRGLDEIEGESAPACEPIEEGVEA